MAEEKLAFAETTVSVHIARASEPGLLPDGTEAWDVDSRILSPGETIALAELPKYQRDAASKGQIPGLKVMTQAAAKKRVELYNDLVGAQDAVAPPEFAEEDPEFPVEEV